MSTGDKLAAYGIVGLGRIGGSIAKGLRRANTTVEIVAVDPDPQTRALAGSEQVADVVLAEAGPPLARCRCVIMAVPMGHMEVALQAVHPFLAPEALLTDVAGVKAAVESMVRKLAPGVSFVGAHPMAGGELGGLTTARADLFAGCPVAVCPPAGEQARAAAILSLWQSLGAVPVLLSAEEHDRAVALSSHLPYLCAVALSRQLGDPAVLHGLVGRGLADAIRRAGFAPEVMAAAALRNPHLAAAVRRLSADLATLADQIEKEPRAIMQAAEDARRVQQVFAALPHLRLSS